MKGMANYILKLLKLVIAKQNSLLHGHLKSLWLLRKSTNFLCHETLFILPEY
jgi:hypothetical protein